MNNPFNNELLRNWFYDHLKHQDKLNMIEFPLGKVVTTGSSPFEEVEFDNFLIENNIHPYFPSKELKVMVIGSEDWDEYTIIEMFKLHANRKLKIYTQEMFISYLFTGHDPLKAPTNILKQFLENHNSYLYLKKLGFDWELQIAPRQINIYLDTYLNLEKYLLPIMGYFVGKDGLSKYQRQRFLSDTFEKELPQIQNISKKYLREWGNPFSPQRLKKIAYSIAILCKNAKKKSKLEITQPLKDWEEDLVWLYKKYYIPLGFSFHWPDTNIWET